MKDELKLAAIRAISDNGDISGVPKSELLARRSAVAEAAAALYGEITDELASRIAEPVVTTPRIDYSNYF